jgi:hypothetical protein
MALRNRKFEKGETTLDFNEEDIAREETQQADGEKSTSTGEDVESSVSSKAPQNGTSTDTSEIFLLDVDGSATK